MNLLGADPAAPVRTPAAPERHQQPTRQMRSVPPPRNRDALETPVRGNDMQAMIALQFLFLGKKRLQSNGLPCSFRICSQSASELASLLRGGERRGETERRAPSCADARNRLDRWRGKARHHRGAKLLGMATDVSPARKAHLGSARDGCARDRPHRINRRARARLKTDHRHAGRGREFRRRRFRTCLPCGNAATRTRTRSRGTQDVPHAGGDVHVHILSTGSPEVERYLRLRDTLRNSAELRRQYHTLKQALAGQD